jgi:hypothetical protein
MNERSRQNQHIPFAHIGPSITAYTNYKLNIPHKNDRIFRGGSLTLFPAREHHSRLAQGLLRRNHTPLDHLTYHWNSIGVQLLTLHF